MPFTNMSILTEGVNEPARVFRRALLKSEQKRIWAVIAFVVFFAVLAAIRIFVFGSSMSRWGLVAAGVLIACETWLLTSVNRAVQSDAVVSPAMWYAALIFESLFPAIGAVYFSSGHLLQDYRPLASPWVIAYFPLILLSVLRLSSWVCNACGCASAVGYLAAAYTHGWRFNETLHGYTATQTAVLYFALLLLGTGILAGAVASEIRTHVEVAMHEAETRYQLKEVEHELQIARSIQQSLLPKLRPQIPGFAVAGWSQAAHDTGGDFYDWKRLSKGRWVVLLADVTGHGIGPAMLASVCRAYSRASFNDHDNLATTVKNINHSFSEDLTPERFATFVAAVFQEGSNQIELLSAGHGPIFIYSARDKSLQRMHAQILPLGVAPEIDGIIPVTLAMQTGDLVLLITDGFFEWEDPNQEPFGTERLAEALQRFSDREPEVIIAELYHAVLQFSKGTSQKDDLTAVIIKRTDRTGCEKHRFFEGEM
jgi:serine phosphatase RsbU (regulator of sigma subunit)